MILNANGITLDYFNKLLIDIENYIEDKKVENINIAVSFSGGIDSSLTMYCLCKTILEFNKQKEVTVYAFNANVLDYEFDEVSKTPTLNCYEVITEMFPDIQFGGVHLYDISGIPKGQEKTPLLRKARNKFQTDHNIHRMLLGSTKNPPVGASPEIDEAISKDKVLQQRYREENLPFKNEPFAKVDKSFLSEIYKQEDLMYDLYPYTVSCVDMGKIGPCKKCYWCHEKKWSFGMYDGGVR
jgi:hypothetical protein